MLSGGHNIFGMKKGKIAEFSEAVVKLAKDENALKSKIEEVATLVQERLNNLGVTTQERVRDTIRSESFSTSFRDRVLPAAS